jgi:hypothetical protein
MNQRGIARATFRPVAETLSTPEVAHAIGHHHGKTRGEKHAERVEILEAILLAVVAVATAWSGYQTARWDGRQAHLYGLSSKARAAENRASTLSGQQRLYDTSTFGFWLQEKATTRRLRCSSGASDLSTGARLRRGFERTRSTTRARR